MRRLNLMILIIGVAIIFFGCSKNNSMAPDISQGDELTSSLKGHEITFTGTSNFVAPGEEGTTTVLPNGNILIKGQTAEWYDEADDWRVTGKSFWTVNWLITGVNTAKVWGKCEIIVDGENPSDPSRGIWKLSWHGYQTPTFDEYGDPDGFTIVCDANGTGKEGDVKGMVGKWTYTMDISEGFFYATKGYIK